MLGVDICHVTNKSNSIPLFCGPDSGKEQKRLGLELSSSFKRFFFHLLNRCCSFCQNNRSHEHI